MRQSRYSLINTIIRICINVCYISQMTYWKYNGSPINVSWFKLYHHLVSNFNDLISVISVLHFFHLRFCSVQHSNPLFPREALNGVYLVFFLNKWHLGWLTLLCIWLWKMWLGLAVFYWWMQDNRNKKHIYWLLLKFISTVMHHILSSLCTGNMY